MSKEFIEAKYNSNSLDVAVRQYKQLSYFLQSQVSEEVRGDYYKKYVDRGFYNNDIFLNWVKSVFKTDNFLSFANYYRNPNPSSKLINTRIKETLSRVFFSEDSYFNYVVNDQYIQSPKELEDNFEERLFDAVLFRYNDIIVHDLFERNTPYREFVSIKNVVSIKMSREKISQIAYTASAEINGEEVVGYAYIDDKKYCFFDKNRKLLKEAKHDLGFCPATFVVDSSFGNDIIVKESTFSYLKADFEEYCFLKTLQRMVDANGTLPITVKIKTKEKSNDFEDFDSRGGTPMSIDQIGSQVSEEARSTSGNGKGSILQAGTVVETPPVEDKDGNIDTNFNKNYLVFHYAPIEALKFLDERIKSVERDIIISCVGDFSEGTSKGSKSDTEIKSNDIVSKQDKLRFLSNTLSSSRSLSDKVMLSLANGKDNVKVDVFYGSDFFLETQDKLYEMFSNSPNAIERKNILIRLSQRRNMFNKEKSKREVLLYKLMPYTSDKDFVLAVDNLRISEVNFEYQSRFSYWISKFESTYGNIVIFYDNLGSAKESEKIISIDNLINNLITSNTNFNNNISDGKETNS
tara:strand:- start:314 stop:2041 length:1728 start_codon:yes stop_codon:yes gene_type:complete